MKKYNFLLLKKFKIPKVPSSGVFCHFYTPRPPVPCWTAGHLRRFIFSTAGTVLSLCLWMGVRTGLCPSVAKFGHHLIGDGICEICTKNIKYSC